MDEIWKPCVGYDGKYLVSNLGRVWSTVGKGRLLVPQTNHLGYKFVNLRINGKAVKPKLHRLVALAFLPNPENKTDVNHIDRDKSNNRLDNLEWTTHKENMYHSYDDIFGIGIIQQLNLDGTLVAEYPSYTEAGEAMDCSYMTISRYCKDGRTYKGFKWKLCTPENT